MKQKIKQVREWVEERLRWLCGELSPEKRLFVILSMCLLFGIASCWMFVSNICRIGKGMDAQPQIEHIRPPRLMKPNDSSNLVKYPLYEQQPTDDGE